MTEDLSDDESYDVSIDNSITESKEMLEPKIMEQFVEGRNSVDDKVQNIEDDDSIKFSSRSLGLGSSSSSSPLSSSNDEDIIIQQNTKRRISTRTNTISKINKHRKKLIFFN